MKKIIGTFVFLLCVAAVVFFLGWTQFKVKPDSCGILVSKTGGVNSSPVLPGQFSWHWEPLLPTNASLKIFSLKPVSVSKTISNSLPSAEVYSKMYEHAPDFSYKFDFLITVKVTPENIIALLKDGTITDSDSLNAYIDQSCTALATKASSKIIEKTETDTQANATVFSTEELVNMSLAKKDFPNLNITNFVCNSAHFPDKSLYENAKSLFIEAQKIEAQKKAAQAQSAVNNAKNDERNKRVDELISELQQLKNEGNASATTPQASSQGQNQSGVQAN